MSEPAVLYSGLQMDGGWRAVTGMETGGHSGSPIFVVHSGILDFFDGTTTGYTHFPFKIEVIGAVLWLTETLGTATSTLIIGTEDDTDHYVASTTVPMTAATTAAPIKVPLTLTNTVTADPGLGIGFVAGNGATATGKGYAHVFVKALA